MHGPSTCLLIASLTFFGPLLAEEPGLVERYVDAFNRHDVNAMATLADEDVRWMSVSGAEISVEAVGREQLRTAMEDYFASVPSACSEIRAIEKSGPFVQVIEEAFWRSGGKEKSQCSTAVYETRDGRIRNVWYFPAHECPELPAKRQ